jgi:hypothetical protein
MQTQFDIIAAKISEAVYHNPLLDQLNHGYQGLNDWEFVKASNYQDWQNGYFGAAFKNGNTIIIGHRGTEILDIGDIRNDLKIFLDKPLSQVKHALNFSKEVKAMFKDNFTILHTGHSLGGYIAEIVGLDLNQHSISFDAPGTYEAAKKIVPNLESVLNDTSITAYLASPNFINTLGEHSTDKFYKIEHFTNPSGVGHTDYLRYSVDQHSMKRLMDSFSQETGLPREYELVEHWPKGVEDGYKAFLNNNKLWEEKAKQDWMENIVLDSVPLDPEANIVEELRVQDIHESLDSYKLELDAKRISALSHLDNCLLDETLYATKNLIQGVSYVGYAASWAWELKKMTFKALYDATSSVGGWFYSSPIVEEQIVLNDTIENSWL